MRSSLFVATSVLAGAAACSTPDRDFAPGDSSSASTSSSTETTTTTTTGGPGSGGAGSGAGPATGGGPSSTGGGGAPEGCGNGTLDEGEECDEATSLCEGCAVVCPSGWFQVGRSCFAVALNDVDQYDALTADAKCGALAVSGSGHRAHAATPTSQEELEALATRCPNNGCWLGYYALGPPGELVFSAPTSSAALPEAPPWGDGEPTGEGTAVCLKLALDGASGPALDDQACSELGYFACELEPSYGSFATCGDAVLDDGEECDGGEGCIDCDRRCEPGWAEDPTAHLCLQAIADATTWSQAGEVCEGFGGRLATPDDVSDVRIAQVVGYDTWVGLDAADLSAPTWISGEDFDYLAGTFPLPSLPITASAGLLIDGEILFAAPDEARGLLCEMHDPDM